MISLDTNILVRFLVRDDETQYLKVANLLSQLELNEHTAFVSLLVVLEMNWVLSYSYDFNREQIIFALSQLLTLPMLRFEYQQSLLEMLIEAKDTTFDLADLIIGCHYTKNSHLPIITFDKKASKIPNFQRLL